MFKDVFISHAKEDIEFAEELYVYLTEVGYSPWLDKKKIRAGANWDYEIKKALKKSDYIIILLSSSSVKKRGYIQKEFKYALEYWENKLADDIYIIPIVLDECEIPEQLLKFHWIQANVDYKESILDSLNYQKAKYLESASPSSIALSDYQLISLGLDLTIENKINYECELPFFKSNESFDSNFINTFIQHDVYETIGEFRNWIINDEDFINRNKKISGYIDISHNIVFLNRNFLSLSISCESYLGGAHPSTSFNTLNFNLNPEYVISLRDIIEFENIEEFINELIENFGDKEQKEYLPRYVEYLDEYLDFTFNENVLIISFINIIPRAIMALGLLEIPLKDLKMKIILDDER